MILFTLWNLNRLTNIVYATHEVVIISAYNLVSSNWKKSSEVLRTPNGTQEGWAATGPSYLYQNL
jgi:hypothetical protein